MKLILLLLTISTSAQQFSSDGKYYMMPIEQLPKVWTGLQLYEDCKTDNDSLRAKLIDCSNDVISMQNKYEESEQLKETLRQEKENALEEAFKINAEAKILRSQKPTKFSVGPYIGYGYNVNDKGGGFGGSFGISFQLTLFRF